MGLWHWANWNFLIFGILHGLAYSCEVLTKKTRMKLSENIPRQLYNSISLILTFSFINLTFIFFRANNISDAFFIVKNILRIDLWQFKFNLPLGTTELIIVLFSIFIMEFVHLLQRKSSVRQLINGKPIWFRWACYYAIVFLIILSSKYDAQPFVYFQF